MPQRVGFPAIFTLAQNVNLPEDYANQRLLEHANLGRIDLTAYDETIGQQRNWCNCGTPPAAMFRASSNGGYVDSVLLLPGAEYAELLLKRPIGFTTA